MKNKIFERFQNPVWVKKYLKTIVKINFDEIRIKTLSIFLPKEPKNQKITLKYELFYKKNLAAKLGAKLINDKQRFTWLKNQLAQAARIFKNQKNYALVDIVAADKKYNVSIYKWVEAENWLEKIKKENQIKKQDLLLASQWLFLFHNTKLIKRGWKSGKETSYWKKFLAKISSDKNLTKKCKKIYLAKRSIDHDPKYQFLVHSDFHPQNLYFTKNKIIVLDFDLLGIGSPVNDLLSFKKLFFDQIKNISADEKNKAISYFSKNYLKLFNKKFTKINLKNQFKAFDDFMIMRMADFVISLHPKWSKEKSINYLKTTFKKNKI